MAEKQIAALLAEDEMLVEVTKMIKLFDTYRDAVKKEIMTFDASLSSNLEYKWLAIRELAIMMLVANGYEINPEENLATMMRTPKIKQNMVQDMDQAISASERAGYLLKSLVKEY